jgi:uncharacterized protein DUF4743
MSLLDRVAACHGFDPAAFRRFIVAGEAVGWILPEFADKLRPYGEVFAIAEKTVTLKPALDSFTARTEAVAAVLRHMVKSGALWRLRGEPYAVATRWGAPALMSLDRAVVPAFGIEAYGLHVNGYVMSERHGLEIWVGKRARDKATAPGKLDHLIAGGQPHGITLADNLVKEAGEEAGFAPEIANRAVPVGAVSYRLRNAEGLRNDVLFCYDLALSRDIVPVNTDGEVEEFFLWPVARVIERLENSDDFKFNVALVTIDFLIRRGLIGPERADYLDLVAGRQAGWRGN